MKMNNLLIVLITFTCLVNLVKNRQLLQMPKTETCMITIVDNDYGIWQQNKLVASSASCNKWSQEKTEIFNDDIKDDLKMVEFADSSAGIDTSGNCQCDITMYNGTMLAKSAFSLGNGPTQTTDNPSYVDRIKYKCQPSTKMQSKCKIMADKIKEEEAKQTAAENKKAEDARKADEVKQEAERIKKEEETKKKYEEKMQKLKDAEANSAASKGGEPEMPPMPGAPEATPEMPEKFDVLIAFGLGNMKEFSGEVTSQNTAASKTQVTVRSQCTQEGLFFESDKINLKFENGEDVNEDERKPVFMESKKEEGNWVIPARKINGCQIMYNGPDKFNYEVISMSNDKKDGATKFDNYSITLRNNYEYLKGNMTNTMSNKSNMAKFCAKLNYCAETQRAGVQAYRQNLLELVTQINGKCNNAARNNADQEGFETMQDTDLKNASDQIIKDNANIAAYNKYKVKVIAPGILESNAKIADLTRKIKDAREAIKSAKIVITAKITLISTYETQDKQMDDYKVIVNAEIKKANEDIKKDNEEINANVKSNKVDATKNYDEAKRVHKEFTETGMKMVQAGRGIKRFYDKANKELKAIIDTKCGKEQIKFDTFNGVRTTLKDIFASANPNLVRKLRESPGIDE